MPQIDADRNLLFGITALQNDFITRDALIAAMNAWALEKHRPIGEILVERAALDPGDRDALEAMIARRLAKHGDDPARSLAALSSAAGVAGDLRRAVDDPDVLASIAYVPADSQLDPNATRAPETADYSPVGLRYRKVRDHAQGGLGIVYVAHDEELRREVALKEIKPEYADNPASQSRFVLEAEITGGLEHPGIVPVYGLGHHDDGRPFYAMRFIRGDSLKHAIAAFHADEALKRDPGARTLALQKLLRRFLDVCNAIAYAHSRGVLHRDLKPDNVMVGRFGETLVVDWGLAKATGRSGTDGYGPLPESTLLQPSSSGSAETLPGSIIGTPSYMSPEQAAGRLDLLGPASDVYSLGATLYTLLTGRVPFAEKELAEVLRKVERGEFPRPREASPWLDPALEAICLKAMALGPADRYPLPKALADDIERWIADEPVAAYPEPFTRRARRWSKKHRTSLTTAMATALVATLLIGGFAWRRLEHRRQTNDAGRTILARAEGLATQARTSGELPTWDKAVAEALLARERLESGDGSPALRLEVDARLEAFRTEQGRRAQTLAAEARDNQVVAALEEARLQGANVKDGAYDAQARLDAYLAAFRAYGIDLATLPIEDAARRIRSSRVADDLIAILDDWVRPRSRAIKTVPSDRLAAIARAAETDPIRLAIRDALSRSDAATLRRLCESEDDRRNLGPRIRHIFVSLLSIDPAGSFPLLKTILSEHPSDFWLNQELGVACGKAEPPKREEAIHYFSIAVALRTGSPGVYCNLGVALQAQGLLDQAIAEYRTAIRIKPNFAQAHYSLGTALSDQGQLDQAIVEYRAAIRLKPDLPDAYFNIGNALRDQGKLDQAIPEYRAALRIQPDYAKAQVNIGNALKAQGKLDQAIAEYRAAIRIQPDLAEAHTNLGTALSDQGQLDQAIAEHRAAILIQPDFAEAHGNLALALEAQGQLDQAIAEHRATIRIKPDLAQAHNNLGNALQSRGQLEEAIAEHRAALRIKPEYAEAHSDFGLALIAQGQLDQAIAEYQAALRLKPNFAEAHYNLGNALRDKGQLDQAIAEYRAFIRLRPDYARAYFNLGGALSDQRQFGQAITEYRTALRLKPDYVEAHTNLGLALRAQGHLDQAIDEYRVAIRLKPDYAPAYCNLGADLLAIGRFSEALESLKKGHELGSKQPAWRYPSEAWVRKAQRLVDLEAIVPAILKGEATPKDSAERLTLADLCYKTGRYAASARFWGEAFAETPALADDLAKGHRYNAACSASLAGSSQGKDDPLPDETGRIKLREQALGWLRADLAAWAKVLEGGNEPARKQLVAKTLAHWKEDADLAGIRDEASLAKLPEQERNGFRALWADVERLLAKARAGAP